jgi:ribosomal protein S27E
MIEELNCGDCHTHLGWMVYAGPRGSVMCDECKVKWDRSTCTHECGRIETLTTIACEMCGETLSNG